MASEMGEMIRLDDLSGSEVAAFIDEHICEMKDVSPPESNHALDLDGLRDPSIRFWTVWGGTTLIGCGGLKRLNDSQAEIKAMRTHRLYRGKGVGSRLLEHLITDARNSGITDLFLETGSFSFFEPARALYAKSGFSYCEPFGDYVADPNSVFMCITSPKRTVIRRRIRP